MQSQKKLDRLVLKVGGRTLLCKDGLFSADRVHSVAKACYQMLNVYNRIIVVVGAAGAHHYIDVARQAHASDGECDEIGIAITAIAAKNVLYALRFLKVRVYPKVPTSLDDIDIALDNYQVVVVGPINGSAVSSDSTAAILAEHVGAKILIILKVGVRNIQHLVRKRSSEKKNAVQLKDLMKVISTGTERAGDRPILDIMALRVFQRTSYRIFILRHDEISNCLIKRTPIASEHCYEIVR